MCACFWQIEHDNTVVEGAAAESAAPLSKASSEPAKGSSPTLPSAPSVHGSSGAAGARSTRRAAAASARGASGALDGAEESKAAMSIFLGGAPFYDYDQASRFCPVVLAFCQSAAADGVLAMPSELSFSSSCSPRRRRLSTSWRRMARRSRSTLPSQGRRGPWRGRSPSRCTRRQSPKQPHLRGGVP